MCFLGLSGPEFWEYPAFDMPLGLKPRYGFTPMERLAYGCKIHGTTTDVDIATCRHLVIFTVNRLGYDKINVSLTKMGGFRADRQNQARSTWPLHPARATLLPPPAPLRLRRNGCEFFNNLRRNTAESARLEAGAGISQCVSLIRKNPATADVDIEACSRRAPCTVYLVLLLISPFL
eukprot:COSAG02_NODE_3839_length_6162_cov_4.006762_4_plen_177_part_00